MTVEERARELIKEMMHSSGKPIQPIIEQALRDQIEGCAKIGDEQAAFHKSEAERLCRNEDAANCEKTGEHAAERIAARIRALATPREKPKDWKTPILTLEEESPKPTNYYD